MRPTRVFTWHNSSLRVSRRASMHWSCAMMSSSVTPLKEKEGADVDRAEGVGWVVIPDCLDRTCASLHLTIVTSVAHMTWKWSKTRKGTKKGRKILVIAEGKMSLSQVVVSLYTSMMERIKWEGKYIVRCFKRESKNQVWGLVMEL